MCSRTNGTGSVSVIGSAITNPAGTQPACATGGAIAARGSRPAAPHSDHEVPSAMSSEAGRDPCAHGQNGERKDAEEEGGRHLQRIALLVAVCCTLRTERANAGVATSTTQSVVAARAAMDARAEARSVLTASTAARARGARRTAAVRPTGRGARSATSTTNHTDHNSTAAVAAVALRPRLQPSPASGPTVMGSVIQATRSNMMFTSTIRAGFEVRATPRSYTTNLMLTSPHAGALAPGLATGIGSLPHQDAHAAAALTFHVHPRLPGGSAASRPHSSRGSHRAVARALPGSDGGIRRLAWHRRRPHRRS